MYLTSRAEDANVTLLPPPPYVLPPSGEFDGNDGRWSSFRINVGDREAKGRGQNFRVLVSTSSSVLQVPAQASWCDDDECARDRGIEVYQSRQQRGLVMEASTDWVQNGIYNFPTPYWWDGRNLNATYGWSSVGLGFSSPESPILLQQTVVANIMPEFFMGWFGLSINPIHTGGDPMHTILYNLAGFNQTPSKSYGYTAGASYRNDNRGIPGNLVLGGYDKSRMANGLEVKMEANGTLLVGVQGIEYLPDRDVDTNTVSLTSDRPTGFLAAIDSTLPFLQLPEDICDQFADIFGLDYDEDNNVYTFEPSARNYNRQQNATVSFKLGEGVHQGSEAVSISLPWAAFDLESRAPPFNKSTPYFPLRKSANGPYVLGRVFLQESYLVVDYERENFTIAQALYSDPMPSEDVISIYSKDFNPPKSSETSAIPAASGGGGLSGGAVAGIVLGIVVVLGLIGAGAFLWWKRRKDQERKAYEKENPQEIDTMQAADQQVKHRRISELDSQTPGSPKSPMGGYYDGKVTPFPPLTELDSPPAELYSPQPESIAARSSETSGNEKQDYFQMGGKMRRRGATRDSSTGGNTPITPGYITPVAELPGDHEHNQYGVVSPAESRPQSPAQSPVVSPLHSRGPSDAANIDEVLSGKASEAEKPKSEKSEESEDASEPQPQVERRPSHARGLSDTTVKSDETAVSQPTPEELEDWAKRPNEPRRPLSE